MIERLSLWGPVVGLMALIFWLSSRSILPSPATFFLTDKQVHAMTYGVLALLVGRALARARWSGVTAGRMVVAVAVAVLYGVTDEWHQSFVPGRTPDVADLYADASGAACAAVLLWACGIIAARRTSRRADTIR